MLRKTAFPILSFAIFATCAVITTAQPVAGGSQAVASAPSRIVAPIDDSVRFTLAGSRHPLARVQNDIGALNGATRLDRMILVLGASPDQEYQARTLLDSMHTKGSPNYHNWLTPENFGRMFGPSPQDLQQITAWLTQQGFTVTGTAKSHRWIEFSGTSAQVEAAFQTQMRRYLVAGEMHVANASELSIPAALSPVVKGVASLHNFFSKPMVRRYRPDANIPFGSGEIHAIAPGDLAAIYDIPPLSSGITGAGQTVAIVAVSNINTNDMTTFQTDFGLAPNVPNVILNGPDPGIDPGDAGFEATLDTEWSGAVAQGATIDVVVSGGSLTTDPVLLGSMFIVDQNLASIMNVSFGFCESGLGANPVDGNQFWSAVWEQAAAQGISVFVSSGDSGAAGCDAAGETLTPASQGLAVSGFASTPFNTAVGGTEFNETLNGGLDATFWNETSNILSSAKGYIPEMVWNDSCTPTQTGTVCPKLDPTLGQFLLLGSGGGSSEIYGTPSYQTIAGIPGLAAAVSNGFRAIPDISLDAAVQHDPYIVCFTPPGSGPDCQLPVGPNSFPNLAGGTSFASPEFAGIMALINQKLGGRQGLANYVLYPLAAAANLGNGNCNSNNRTTPGSTTCVFNDTTVGNNGVPGNDVTNNPVANALGFPAVTGFDLATGLGTVDVTNLVNAWSSVKFQGSQTTLTSAPVTINITHGQPISFTVNVQKSGGGAGPTGTASIVTSQTAPHGTFTVGAGVLSGGSFTASFNTLPGGTYNITAHYPGDGTFAASDSNPIAATVARENTSTTLQPLIFSLANNTIIVGNTVSYGDGGNILVVDADVIGASGLVPATGSVQYTVNGQSFSVAIDNSGISEFADCFTQNPISQANCLTPGSYTFSAATYSGDGVSYNGSSASSGVTITVTKGNPSVSLSANTTESADVAFTIGGTVLPPQFASINPTGTVQYMDGTTPLGAPVTVVGAGVADTTVTLNSGGQHIITAQYSGDGTYNPATAAPLSINVIAPFELLATTTSQTIAAGGTATFNATLADHTTFSGTVTLSCSGAPGGSTCSVNPATANISPSNMTVPFTVTVSNTANARLKPTLFRHLPFVFAGLLGAAMFGLRRRPRRRLLATFAIFVVAGLSACGGGSHTPPPTNATLTVTASNGSISTTLALNLTITH